MTDGKKLCEELQIFLKELESSHHVPSNNSTTFNDTSHEMNSILNSNQKEIQSQDNRHSLPKSLKSELCQYFDNCFATSPEGIDDFFFWINLLNALSFDISLYKLTKEHYKKLNSFLNEEWSTLFRQFKQVIVKFIYNVMTCDISKERRREFFFTPLCERIDEKSWNIGLKSTKESDIESLSLDKELGEIPILSDDSQVSKSCVIYQEWFISIFRDLIIPEEDSDDDSVSDSDHNSIFHSENDPRVSTNENHSPENLTKTAIVSNKDLVNSNSEAYNNFDSWFDGLNRKDMTGEIKGDVKGSNSLTRYTDEFTLHSRNILQKLLLWDISHKSQFSKLWDNWLLYLMNHGEWTALTNVLDILELFLTEEDKDMTGALQELIGVSITKLLKIFMTNFIYDARTPLKFCQFECLFVMIQVIAHATVSDFYDAHFVRIAMHKEGLLPLIRDLLLQPSQQEKLDQHVNEEILKHTGLQVLKEKRGFNNMYYYYKSNMIRILGNMAYEDCSISLDLLKQEIIPVILNHTKIDDLNPFIREWAILALNHMCELSEEIRAYLQELRTLQVDPTTESMLNKIGAEASIENDRIAIRTNPKKPSS